MIGSTRSNVLDRDAVDRLIPKHANRMKERHPFQSRFFNYSRAQIWIGRLPMFVFWWKMEHIPNRASMHAYDVTHMHAYCMDIYGVSKWSILHTQMRLVFPKLKIGALHGKKIFKPTLSCQCFKTERHVFMYKSRPLWDRAFQLGQGEGPIGLVGPIFQPRGTIGTASLMLDHT